MGEMDQRPITRGFIVPLFCFAFVAFYGFNWPRFSKVEGRPGPLPGHGH